MPSPCLLGKFENALLLAAVESLYNKFPRSTNFIDNEISTRNSNVERFNNLSKILWNIERVPINRTLRSR